MKHVYLDQNHWISLARAARGRPAGEPYHDVLTLVSKAVDLRIASFRISSQHYFETHKQHDSRKRHDLATTMATISRFDTLAGLPELVPSEIDLALRRRFGRPIEPRRSQPFGQYLEHAFGQPRIELDIPAGLAPDQRDGLHRAMQLAILGADMRKLGIGAFSVPVDQLDAHNELFRSSRAGLDERFRAQGTSRVQQIRHVAAGALVDIIEPLRSALTRAGISWDEFAALGEDGWIEFIADLPTRDVDAELLRLRHQNPQKRWDKNDLADITALAVAVVYCDVVVTERLWVDLLRRASLDRKYATVVLADLRDLAPILMRG